MASDRTEVAAKLREHGAVLFLQQAASDTFSARMRADNDDFISTGALAAVFCDAKELGDGTSAGASGKHLCERAGITVTPSLVFGGAVFRGFLSYESIKDALHIPTRVSERLASRKAVFYGDAACPWSARQHKALDKRFLRAADADMDVDVDAPAAAGRIAFVDCSTQTQSCLRAGVHMTPAWSIDGVGPIFGYQSLPALARLATAEHDELQDAAKRSLDATAACK